MVGTPHDLAQAFTSLALALLIGLIVGVQRESVQKEHRPGLRDFVLVALGGAVCGLIDSVPLTVTTLFGVIALLAVARASLPERTGITTEIAAIVLFALGYLVAAPGRPWGSAAAIATTIVITAFLEAKKRLEMFIREGMTTAEFNDTLGFLAVIFVIYPVLPLGAYGPYDFFAPRKVWLFVILVSSISYVGYFLQKYLGGERGMTITGVLGGIASTTATTVAMARDARAQPEAGWLLWQSTVLANAIQFPRVLLILEVVSPGLGWMAAPLLMTMFLAGVTFALLLRRFVKAGAEAHKLVLGNPFRLLPALKYGAVFAAILLINKAAAARFGETAVYWTSAIGGSVDVDAVVVTLSEMLGRQIDTVTAIRAVWIALAANAALKTSLAAIGGAAFAGRIAISFIVMFGAGLPFILR